MSEEKTRDYIIEIINNVEEPVKELINEEIKEEIKEEEIKPKAKPKLKPRAKPKIKIVKESVVEETVVEEKPEPIVVEEPPKQIDRLKEIVKCPDCKMDMTQHTLKYIHKRRGFCKAAKAPEPEKPLPEPVAQPNPKITEDIANHYIKQNPDTVSNYLRNARAMKAQRKQMNARSLLNNVFNILLLHFIIYNKRCRIRRKQILVLFSLIN